MSSGWGSHGGTGGFIRRKRESWAVIKICTNMLPKLGTVAHTSNPNTFRCWGRRITWAQEFRTSLGNIVTPSLYKWINLNSWAWWHAPVVPTTQEAERRGSFELSLRLQWAMTLHSSLGDRVRHSLKTNLHIHTHTHTHKACPIPDNVLKAIHSVQSWGFSVIGKINLSHSDTNYLSD